jgi:hypothetical protein
MLAEQPARDLTGLGGPLKADLSGQWLRLPANVGSAVLCLDLEAHPLGRLVETDETDNATSVAFRVDGTKIRKVSSAACR